MTPSKRRRLRLHDLWWGVRRLWRVLLALSLLVGAALTMWLTNTKDGEQAPAYALLAATLHLMNSTPTAPNPLTRSCVRMVELVVISSVLLSAYHWALGESGRTGWLTLLAVIAVLVACVPVWKAARDVGVEIRRRLEERRQDDRNPEPD